MDGKVKNVNEGSERKKIFRHDKGPKNQTKIHGSEDFKFIEYESKD